LAPEITFSNQLHIVIEFEKSDTQAAQGGIPRDARADNSRR